MPAPTPPFPIAFVTTELRPGGAERNLVALARGLNRAQFTPRVYSLAPPPAKEQSELVELLDEAGIQVNFIGVERSRQFFAAVRRLRHSLAQRPPALIQSFLFHANVVAAVAARGMNIPVVAGLRVAQREQVRSLVERRLVGSIKRFVCVSESVANVAAKHGGLPREKLIVIPNGIDPKRFANIAPADLTQLGVRAGQKVVLFIGRLDRQKGVDVLIDAARSFLPERGDVTLLIVGDGDAHAALQQQVEALSLTQQVVSAPWQPNPLAMIAAAEVMAIPSRWEGMSNVLMEAISLGRPVVATDVEGVRDLLSPEGHEWIVPVENASALAAKINDVIDGGEAVNHIAEATRRRLLSEFSLEKTVASYTNLYRSLISRVG